MENPTEGCPDPLPGHVNQPAFPATHWSAVLGAAEGKSDASSAALDQLCGTYWYPLYAYVRRRGYGPEDARDLTQEFFARLLANHGLQTVSPLKGKFRSFLLASMNHLLSDERDRANRQKRGCGRPILSFDGMSAEQRYQSEPVDEMTAEKVFEHRWALVLLEQVLRRLEQEYCRGGKGQAFSVLQSFLTGEDAERDYAVAARKLGMTKGAARVAVSRLRQRFGTMFRAAVAETVDKPEEIEAEMQHLRAALGG